MNAKLPIEQLRPLTDNYMALLEKYDHETLSRINEQSAKFKDRMASHLGWMRCVTILPR